MAIYSWHEIGDVPAAPGVYAWYYTPEITAFDLDRITSDILDLKAGQGTTAAKDAVRGFLEETVFRYFQEQPYSAQLRGPLKPRYEGKIEHRPTLSESLLDRIVEEPARLATIRTVLEASLRTIESLVQAIFNLGREASDTSGHFASSHCVAL